MKTLLEIENLTVTFVERRGSRAATAVRGLNLTVRQREVVALVGESGSGKSVTNRAILRLLSSQAGHTMRSRHHSDVQVTGAIRFSGRDVMSLNPAELRELRGGAISMIFQEPGRHLNPAATIGLQIRETLRAHRGRLDQTMSDPLEASNGGRAAKFDDRIPTLLQEVELPAHIARRYPHELSGGMKQRAMIAMAVSCHPDLLIADEPVTALDVTVQKQILSLLRRLRSEIGMAMIFVSHDLAVVRTIADRVAVMYAGKIVEEAEAGEFFRNPLHPYATLLLRAIPDPTRRGQKLTAIPGRVPDATRIPTGCAFHTRCPLAEQRCSELVPPSVEHRPGHFAACHFIGAKSV